MNILLLLAHSIEEHDQLKLLSELGYDVFSIGGYINPGSPHDPKRPPLPQVPYHPELQKVVDDLNTDDNLTVAKKHIPDELIDWCDTIIVHHFEHTWLVPQWDRLKHKRIIWRTVGQSVEGNERMMAPYRREGLQIVRYSPKERNIPGFAGEDALIRFYKDPDEWCGWTGPVPQVINITQSLKQRHPYTNWGFWNEATKDLPRLAIGPESQAIGGPGEVSYDVMKRYLRESRVYLYTGTQPASYTLGLIEAMMTGIPVVSIGPQWMNVFAYGHTMFEGHEIALAHSNDPNVAREMVKGYLEDQSAAMIASDLNRARAIELFGKETIGRQWKAFLG